MITLIDILAVIGYTGKDISDRVEISLYTPNYDDMPGTKEFTDIEPTVRNVAKCANYVVCDIYAENNTLSIMVQEN